MVRMIAIMINIVNNNVVVIIEIEIIIVQESKCSRQNFLLKQYSYKCITCTLIQTGPHTYARTQTSFSSNKAKIVSKNLHPKTLLV